MLDVLAKPVDLAALSCWKFSSVRRDRSAFPGLLTSGGGCFLVVEKIPKTLPHAPGVFAGVCWLSPWASGVEGILLMLVRWTNCLFILCEEEEHYIIYYIIIHIYCVCHDGGAARTRFELLGFRVAENHCCSVEFYAQRFL